jgi:hypothetical protein
MTRRCQVTERAATAPIEQSCRMLRLRTIRDRFTEIVAAAEREQMTYLGFLSELVIAECDDRPAAAPNAASATPSFPDQNSWRSSPLTRPRARAIRRCRESSAHRGTSDLYSR